VIEINLKGFPVKSMTEDEVFQTMYSISALTLGGSMRNLEAKPSAVYQERKRLQDHPLQVG